MLYGCVRTDQTKITHFQITLLRASPAPAALKAADDRPGGKSAVYHIELENMARAFLPPVRHVPANG